ncbi:hypothetical protein BKA93DRAFT_542373 [Sparassis latifolia]
MFNHSSDCFCLPRIDQLSWSYLAPEKVYMAAISSRSFTVELTGSVAMSREARRVIINADVLKASNICAGDVVALSAAGNQKAFAVGIAWPSQQSSQDSVLIASSLLPTARLVEGAKVVIRRAGGRGG